MPEQLATSTLELVVNEQQLQNMSQIDLSSGHSQSTRQLNEEQERNDTFGICLKQITSWHEYIKKSFTAKMNNAKSNSDTKLELVLEIICAFASTTTWMLCLLGTIIVPILLFFIGILNLEDCPCQPALPKLVFAIGFVMVASNVFNLASGFDLPILRNHVNFTTEVKDIVASVVNIIFNCVVVFIFILITFYIYRMQPNAITESSGGVEATNNVVITTIPGTIIAVDDNTNSRGNESTISTTTDLPATNHNYQESARDSLYCDSLLYNFTYWFITLSILFVIILSIIGIASCVFNRYKRAKMKGSTSRVFDTQNAFQVES